MLPESLQNTAVLIKLKPIRHRAGSISFSSFVNLTFLSVSKWFLVLFDCVLVFGCTINYAVVLKKISAFIVKQTMELSIYLSIYLSESEFLPQSLLVRRHTRQTYCPQTLHPSPNPPSTTVQEAAVHDGYTISSSLSLDCLSLPFTWQQQQWRRRQWQWRRASLMCAAVNRGASLSNHSLRRDGASALQR